MWSSSSKAVVTLLQEAPWRCMSGTGAKSTCVPAALAMGLRHKRTTRGPLVGQGLEALHERKGTGTSSSCLIRDLTPHYSCAVPAAPDTQAFCCLLKIPGFSHLAAETCFSQFWRLGSPKIGASDVGFILRPLLLARRHLSSCMCSRDLLFVQAWRASPRDGCCLFSEGR